MKFNLKHLIIFVTFAAVLCGVTSYFYTQVITAQRMAHQGEPLKMTVAEKDTLHARELSGVRLSCQILCDHDMTVRAISRLKGSGRQDFGHRPEEQIHPQPVAWTKKKPG